jgi:hypothetical protein
VNLVAFLMTLMHQYILQRLYTSTRLDTATVTLYFIHETSLLFHSWSNKQCWLRAQITPSLSQPSVSDATRFPVSCTVSARTEAEMSPQQNKEPRESVVVDIMAEQFSLARSVMSVCLTRQHFSQTINWESIAYHTLSV